MAQQIAENLYRLDIPLPDNPLKNLNSYLVTGTRNLLIDTGFCLNACRDAMTAQLAEIGADLARTDIFLTHLHTDHSGLAAELHRPGCEIFLGEVDGPLLEACGSEAHWDMLFADYLRAGFTAEELNQIWQYNPAKVLGSQAPSGYTALRADDILRYGGYTFQVRFTPGHTPGHLCLYEPERQVLFCGDHVLFHITPNITRWNTIPDALGTYLESLEDVRDLPVKLLLPAHRLVEGTLRDRCLELEQHHLARIEDAYQAVCRHSGETAHAITGLMRWEIKCRSWVDFPPTQKWFAVGEALAHLDWLERRGRVRSVEQNGVVRYWPADSSTVSQIG